MTYNKTIVLAEQELKNYMTGMTGKVGNIELLCDFETDLFNEHYVVDVKSGNGYIRGNRPRAVLIGVYEFLRRCGCRFLRPGKNGEFIPKVNIEDINISFDIIPANRHRGITIEGSVSLQNILDIVEWSAKVGFNSYFIQFRSANEFFERWYKHKGNEYLEPEKYEESDSVEFVKTIVEKIKERDMIYHAVGHGWTAEYMHLCYNSWVTMDDDCVSDDIRGKLALVNGERKLFKGIPMNTNLCYSDDEIRETLAQNAVKYIVAHPEIDVLHFWLGDNSNNVCECEKCRSKKMSDWYVMILNRIDELLTERKIKTKVCFLIYLDLFWAPETERIINQDRFILMFAPIFRSYTKSFVDDSDYYDIEYKLNHIDYPVESGPYIKLLSKWQEVFKGDSFDFDYHLMWDVNRDFSGETIAEVLFNDIRSLSDLKLNGFMSCQLQRAFYPNGLAFYIMGRALFDGNISYKDVRDEYYKGAFGKDADFVAETFQKIKELVSFAYMRDEIPEEECYEDLKKSVPFMKEWLDNFSLTSENPCQKESLEIMKFSIENTFEVVKILLMIIENKDEKDIEIANKQRNEYYKRRELRFQTYTDGFYVDHIVNGIINCKLLKKKENS